MESIKKLIVSLIVLFLPILIGEGVNAQFLDIQIDIEPKVDANVEQSIDFGQIITGAGRQEIPIGSPNMGVFQIRALRAQRLMISVDIDSELVNNDPLVDATIPVYLSATYTADGVNDYRGSIAFDSNLETVIVNPPENNPNAVWSSIFIYIFGEVDVGNVPIGLYNGEILLTIIYD